MRNYTNTLLFEYALDSISTANQLLYNVADSFLNPTIKVVEEDCGTLLGTLSDLSMKSIGRIELLTGLPITSSRLTTLAASGATGVNVRTSYSCISKGGVCKACLVGSRPRLSSVTVNSSVKLSPELLVDTVQVNISAGDTVITLPYSVNEYDVLYLYQDGSLVSSSSYVLSNNTLTFSSPVGSTTSYLAKFLVVSNVAYYYWLTKTYSGSLIGVKSLLELPLPVKPTLMSSLVNEDDIDAIRLQMVNNPDIAEEDFVQYIPLIKDKLEKAIFVLTLGSIFLNS